jgi:CubicO group peptidase (beta-lactamase class C family)
MQRSLYARSGVGVAGGAGGDDGAPRVVVLTGRAVHCVLNLALETKQPRPTMPRMMTLAAWSTAGRSRAGTLAVLLLSLAGNLGAATSAKVDQLFAPWDRPDSPGAAVVIVKDGEVAYLHGYGCADLEHQVPITPQTLFDVASVAKQFTGLSVAMLVQQGKFSLGDDVRKHLPDVPDFGKPITLKHLVHHSSGLRDWPETLSLSDMDMQGPITLDTIREMVRRQRELDFAPGEEEQYSNTGYNLLAATVAKVTGQSFRTWTDRNLFQPLEMKHTLVCDDPAELIANRANSYAPEGKNKFRRVVSQLAAQGSSSLFISAEDMGRWLLNFQTARVGGPEAIKLMQQPEMLNNGEKRGYAFGLVLGKHRGLKNLSHGGSWAGYRSATIWVPEKRFAAAVLANTSNMNPSDLALKITDLYLGIAEEPSKPASARPSATFKADPSAWEAFLGTYRLGPGWLLTITREGDQLMTQATHEDKFRMTPLSDTKFFVEAYGQPLAFILQSSGTVTNLLYRGINAPKLTIPKPTPALLKGYVGDYWSEELRVITRLEMRGGRLAVCLRTGTWIYLLPTGADRFDTEFGGIALKFARQPTGEATEVKVSGSRVRNLRHTRVVLPKT